MDTAPEETPGSAGPGAPRPPANQGTRVRSDAGARVASSASTVAAGAACWRVSPPALADYFDVDPTIVRVGFVALAFLGGLAVPLYLAGWLLIPDEDADVSVAEESWPANGPTAPSERTDRRHRPN